MTNSKQVIFLKDYQPTPHAIHSVELRFDIHDEYTDVVSILEFAHRSGGTTDLVLDGKELELKKLLLDGRELGAKEYAIEDDHLIVFSPPAAFTLEVHNRIFPHKNTWLEGLYVSKGIYSTQCEAQGFRRITYYHDRPDVMSIFKVTIEADKTKCPVLLSNGNLLAKGHAPNNRHWAVWEDPFKKPAYLFALVAGDLDAIHDTFQTRSGKQVQLAIYAHAKDIDKCAHGMQSLKQSMTWDEDTYGLECDLEQFNIVAVRDFNMGAMENKGLNIFNSSRILATPQTTTDAAFQDITAVIGHEYFHNWTGNRVTCRDWFQLCLKEGLTVFRDQEFSQSLSSDAVQRIDQVQALRQRQFPEDDGPTAHPPRPDHFIEINNFYTTTIYEKGAEVVRMIKTLIGAENFRKGMDLYFARHDGQAVTQEDFVQAMADASGKDLTQFMLWYTQAGAPHIGVEEHYDANAQTYALTLTQKVPPTQGEPVKKPLHIPVRMGLLDQSGAELGPERVLELKSDKQTFTFDNVKTKPTASLFRNFSAPVRFTSDLPDQDLIFLLKHDSDAVNVWEAGQKLFVRQLVGMTKAIAQNQKPVIGAEFKDAFAALLSKKHDDQALLARFISLPSSESVAQQMDVIDPDAIHQARMCMKQEFAKTHRDLFASIYHANQSKGAYSLTPEAIGQRRLKNVCLHYLSSLQESNVLELALVQYHDASNMTDRFVALFELANWQGTHREQTLQHFYDQWRHEDLVMDSWFAVQAQCTLPDSFAKVQQLTQHADFDLKNPNRMRSLVMAFCKNNPLMFHQANGDGYRFCSEYVMKLDGFNRQMAAGLVRSFSQWRRFDSARQDKMRAELTKIQKHAGISSDVFELVGQMLG